MIFFKVIEIASGFLSSYSSQMEQSHSYIAKLKKKKLHEIDRGEPLVAIGAYCLMPNHFHLLVKEISAGGISKFMEKLGTGYSMYFNKKNGRTGFLFQGNFKAEHVDSDEYLKYLFAYIHLNPVKLIEAEWKETGIRDKQRAQKYLGQYRYSSYRDYLGEGTDESLILSKTEFPEYFTATRDFSDYISYWLDYVHEPE